MKERNEIKEARRWVVKVGSALLTDDGAGLNKRVIETLVDELVALRARGCEVVLVSSGAVAAGVVRLGWSARPHRIHELQAAAAVGQSVLVQNYESAFNRHGVATAQVLLGHDDVTARDRYLNARATLKTLLALGVVPVINENDTVVTDEIRFGDNDTLAALVARYHRRAFPKPSHTTYAQLDRESRVILTQMAAILRLAIALAHSRTQRIRSIECQVEKGRLIIIARGRRGDLSMEQLELRQNSPLFEEVFGMSVLLRESTI